MPKISVVMSSYNHAGYVEQSARSVLEQDFGDLELLVADDGSTDGTADVLAGIRDPRLKLVVHRKNRGSAIVRNELMAGATGDAIALQNSDDVWMPGKLAHQVAILDGDRSLGAVFGRVTYINERGRPLREAAAIFDQPNRSRGAWLRRFHELGNCLCHSTVLVRRDLHEAIGGYDPRYRQLPDLELWARLLGRAQIFVSEQVLVQFRRMPGNVSRPTREALARAYNEHFMLAREFFERMPDDLIVEGFGDLMMLKAPPTRLHWDIERALLLLAPAPVLGAVHGVAGLEKLSALMGSAAHREILERDYSIDMLAFQRRMAGVPTFLRAKRARSVLSLLRR